MLAGTNGGLLIRNGSLTCECLPGCIHGVRRIRDFSISVTGIDNTERRIVKSGFRPSLSGPCSRGADVDGDEDFLRELDADQMNGTYAAQLFPHRFATEPVTEAEKLEALAAPLNSCQTWNRYSIWRWRAPILEFPVTSHAYNRDVWLNVIDIAGNPRPEDEHDDIEWDYERTDYRTLSLFHGTVDDGWLYQTLSNPDHFREGDTLGTEQVATDVGTWYGLLPFLYCSDETYGASRDWASVDGYRPQAAGIQPECQTVDGFTMVSTFQETYSDKRRNATFTQILDIDGD